MFFTVNPNLPVRPISLAVVDSRISDVSAYELERLGIKILGVPAHPFLYDAVCCHPDMLLHHIGEDIIVHAPGTDKGLLDELRSCGFTVIRGEKSLTRTYPGDIAYNVARVGRYYFHNLRHTDPVIAQQLDRQGIEPVHIEQGYAKCSIFPVDEGSIITADAGIAKAAKRKGFDVLLMECGNSIRLPGLNAGFIGGSCAMLSDAVCAVNGAIQRLADKDRFISFLTKKQIEIKELSDDNVTDIGSILQLKVYPSSN